MSPEELEQAIQEFREIYQQEYGIYLTREETTKNVLELLQLFDCLFTR